MGKSSRQKRDRKAQRGREQPTDETPPAAPAGPHLLICGALCVLTALVFLPALDAEFVNWDDDIYVTENGYVQNMNGEALVAMFSAPMAANYHPMTMVSLGLEYSLFGSAPGAFHRTNLLLHLLNVILVYWVVLRCFAGNAWVAGFSALVFGIHPMHVESVAWISGRKDVLFGAFFLGGMLAYQRFSERRSPSDYTLALALFVGSLLSKPTAVIFPVVLLAVDFLRAGTLSAGHIKDKVPLLGISLVFGIVTWMVQASSGSVGEFEQFTLVQRLQFASYGFCAYLYKFVAPLHLSAFYPYPKTFENMGAAFSLSPLLALGVIAGAFGALKWTRVPLFVLVFYAAGVALTLQFVTVGDALIADRYTYLPYVGLAFGAGVGLDRLRAMNAAASKVVPVLGCLLLVGGAVLARERVHVWNDDETLWGDVIEKYPDGFAGAYSNRGAWYRREGRLDEAAQDYEAALRIDGENLYALNNLANVYFDLGQLRKAVELYDRVLELDPTNARAFANKGGALSQLGSHEEALASLGRAIELNPRDRVAIQNRAVVHQGLGRWNEAIADLSALLKISPGDDAVLNARGMAYREIEDYAKAERDLDRAIELSPRNAVHYLHRSYVRFSAGNRSGALSDANQAKALGASVDAGYLRHLGDGS